MLHAQFPLRSRPRPPRQGMGRTTALADAAQRACLALLVVSAMPTPMALAAEPAAPAVRRSYAIAAGPLEAVLARFAAAAGIPLSFDPALVADRQSAGISGSYDGEEGLRLLLEGSGLALEPKGHGSYTLRRLPPAAAPKAGAVTSEASVLPTVKVRAPRLPRGVQDEGQASDGYRARTASSVGALGSMDLLDTPFSISVVPQALLQNIQAQSPDDVYKLNPATRTATPQASGWSPAITIRGFNSYDTAEDGLRRPYNHAAVIEDKERVEVLNGLSGFLYGAAAPGGMVNYVTKRPTAERLNSVTLGNYGGAQSYLHGDFGGRLDDAGRAGYRVNVVGQDGNTAVDDQKITRTLVSAAFDWQLSDKLLLELNAAYNHYRTQGASAYWYYSVAHGPAPQASKLWSQPWLVDEFENQSLMGKLTYQLNERVTLRAAYKRDFIDRPQADHAVNAVETAGEFTQIRIKSGRTKDWFDAASALADIAFETGPVSHKLTLGTTMHSDKYWTSPYSPNTGWLGPYPLGTPSYVAEPSFPANTSSMYFAGQDLCRNMVVGDTLRFDAQWSALVGITRSTITSTFLDATGTRTQPDYDKTRNSPSLSVLFKPTPWLTTYASHIEGLEPGGTAPDTARNAGEIMPPMVSQQKELGIKADVAGMMLAGAVFDIEKAYEFTDAGNVYGQSGRQSHRGLELSATGMPLAGLTLFAGATVLNAKVKGGDYDGKSPMNVAKSLIKVYAEYQLAHLPGLSLTGGIYRTGAQWANDANNDRLPSYTTADLGLRYATEFAGRATTLRLNVNNVTNKRYWMNSYYAGSPRSVAFSAQVQF